MQHHPGIDSNGLHLWIFYFETALPARYLGYNIQIAKDDNRLTNGQRRLNMQPLLTVPDDIISQWRKKYTKAGKVTHRSELIQCSDYEIVKTYDTELRGIVNYYSLAYNVSQFNAIKHVAIESAVRTIAAKHKQKTGWLGLWKISAKKRW